MKGKSIMMLLIALAACGGSEDPDASGERPTAGEAAQSAAYGRRAQRASQLVTAHLGRRTLADPDNLQMLMLGYRLTGQDAPLDRWADMPTAVRIANEFDRPRLRDMEYRRLAGLYETTRDIGHLALTMKSFFGEYDPERGGFYLNALTPGQTYSYEFNSVETTGLQIENAGKAQFWPVRAADAEAMVKRPGWRSVGLRLELDILGAEIRQGNPLLHTRLKRYRIHALSSSDEMGEVLMSAEVE